MAHPTPALETIAQPLTLPCALTLPNRLVKCPMQETLAHPPFYDPPTDTFANLYRTWAHAQYGLIITGQVQIDIRFLSVKGDVVCHADSLKGEHFAKWREWARIAKQGGTPCIVQLAHPERMSPAGAGERAEGVRTWCPSEVPVRLGDGWLDRLALQKLLGTPKAMTLAEIDELVEQFKHGARVAHQAGFDGVQIHGAHGFLVSQFLSPHTNRRDDAYGGDPERRMALLRRILQEVRAEHPAPFCVSVKLNSADYMDGTGLTQDEGLEQVRWLIESGLVDFVEISGGNAEQKTSGLHNSFGKKLSTKMPERKESTRIREAFFDDFAEKVRGLQQDRQVQGKTHVPIQLSGGYRSRIGMADGIDSGVTDLIGLGRTAVLEPELPAKKLLNPAVSDQDALGLIGFLLRGQWLMRAIPAKVVGSGLGIQFFYHNMRRLGHGLKSNPNLSLPVMLFYDTLEVIQSGLTTSLGRMIQGLNLYRPSKKID